MSNDSPTEREQVTEAYALVGAASTGFATLEFHIQFILVLLISSKVVSPEAFISVREKQFSQKIRLLKDLIILRFPATSDLRTKGINLVKQLDALRGTRNLYIHGYWLINYQLLLSTGGVRCSDTRWYFDKKDESWSSMKKHDIPIAALKKQITDTGEIFKELHSYNELVRCHLLEADEKNS